MSWNKIRILSVIFMLSIVAPISATTQDIERDFTLCFEQNETKVNLSSSRNKQALDSLSLLLQRVRQTLYRP